jgi:hypothetical protein
LAKALPSSPTTKLTPTTVSISSVYTDTPGDVAVQIYVNSPVPGLTGGVSVSLDGTVLDPALPFPSGSLYNYTSIVSYSFPQPSATGTHVLTVAYPGDATHSASVATYALLVGDTRATGSFTVTAGNLTVANGSHGSIPISATPVAGYSGRIVWSLAVTSSSSTANNLEACYSIDSTSSNNPNAATLIIGVGSACNSAAPAARANFRSLASHAALKDQNSPWSTPKIVMVAGLLVCGSLVTRTRRTRLPLLLTVMILTIASAGVIGCGGSSGSSGSNSGTSTPPANSTNYTLKLTGTDSVNTTIAASTTFTLTVK